MPMDAIVWVVIGMSLFRSEYVRQLINKLDTVLLMAGFQPLNMKIVILGHQKVPSMPRHYRRQARKELSTSLKKSVKINIL
ncbi:transposase domain-containing protein [Shewanella sp. SG41-4]|nr:transposase domain-containing protein [Shewanella sp. SG41-4]